MFTEPCNQKSFSAMGKMRPKDQKELVSRLKEWYPDYIQLIESFESQSFTQCKTQNRFVFIAVGKTLTFWSYYNSKYFPSLRLLHQYPNMMKNDMISVDNGALGPIFAGAKLMAPGVSKIARDFEGDEIVAINSSDPCAPAVGFIKLLQSGPEIMKTGRAGVVGETLLRVGDGMWDFAEIKL